MTIGQILTAKEAAEQVRNSTLTGKNRYRVHHNPEAGTWYVRDHEEAETLADRDGRTEFTSREDAHDLAVEYIG